MKRSFYPYIEGFRGVAVLLVLCSHWLIIEYFPKLTFLNLGFLGVNFFFVLSGFLITEILLIDIFNGVKKVDILKSFFAKRTLRIFPIYYISIIFLAILNANNSVKELPWTLAYGLNIGENWFGVHNMLFMHIWSLCVEEQFYLIWPFILIFTKHKKMIIKIIFGLILGSVLFKMTVYLLGHNNYDSINHSSLFAAIDALAIGGALAYLKHFKIQQWKKISQLSNYSIPIIFVIFLVISFYDFKLINNSILRLISGVLGGIIIVKAVDQEGYLLNKIFKTKVFKFFGKISYGVYLYHWFVSFLLMDYFSSIWENIDFSVLGPLEIIQYHKYLGSFFFFFIITFCIAVISFYCIEKPLLKLKRYF